MQSFTRLLGALLLFDFSSGFDLGRGELLALAAAVFFPLGLIMRRYHSPELSDTHLTQLLFVCGFVALGLVAIPLQVSLPSMVQFSTVVVSVFAGAVVLFSVRVGSYVFSQVPASTAGVILALESPLVALIGYLWFEELPSLSTVVGGVLIVLAVVLITFSSRENQVQAG